MLITISIIVSLLAVWIYRTSVSYKKKERDMLGSNKSSRNKGGS